MCYHLHHCYHCGEQLFFVQVKKSKSPRLTTQCVAFRHPLTMHQSLCNGSIVFPETSQPCVFSKPLKRIQLTKNLIMFHFLRLCLSPEFIIIIILVHALEPALDELPQSLLISISTNKTCSYISLILGDACHYWVLTREMITHQQFSETRKSASACIQNILFYSNKFNILFNIFSNSGASFSLKDVEVLIPDFNLRA